MAYVNLEDGTGRWTDEDGNLVLEEGTTGDVVDPTGLLSTMRALDVPCWECTRLNLVTTQALECLGWGGGSKPEYPIFTTPDFLKGFYSEVCQGRMKTT